MSQLPTCLVLSPHILFAQFSEVWAPVPEFPGYEVSSFARARSLRRKGPGNKELAVPKLMKISTNKRSGHLSVSLRRNGKLTTQQIGHWMLLAFVGPRPVGCEACHNNGNPLDNRLVNLRWDTVSANMIDRIRHGTNPSARLGPHIDTIRDRLAAGELPKDIAPDYGVTRQAISNVKRGTSWTFNS